jgi:membrane protease YdiL (CAAX protease family)
MTDTATSAESANWVGPRLRFLPIVLVLVVGMVALELAFLAVHFVTRGAAPGAHWPQWLVLTLAETLELILALIGIAIARRLLPKADFGLRWPAAGRSYLGAAIFWGTAFGLIMLVADHWPALIHLRPPHVPETATPVNIAGWIGFELLWAGICEETLFRGLLLGVLDPYRPNRVQHCRDHHRAGVRARPCRQFRDAAVCRSLRAADLRHCVGNHLRVAARALGKSGAGDGRAFAVGRRGDRARVPAGRSALAV